MTEWTRGTVIKNISWTPRLFSLQFKADVLPFKAGQFLRVALDVEGERVGRPYSLINAPQEPFHEIYFNIVAQGQLSARLAKLKPGDTLWMDKNPRGFLILDEIPDAAQLWLLATGTGIGPFLSILKTAELWQRFENVVLVHSVSYATDLTYQSTINECVKNRDSQFRYIPLLSREKVPLAIEGRIQTTIINGTLEERAGLHLSPAHSHVMLCGNSAMIKDTVEILGERGMKRHRRRDPGQISSENYF